MFFDQLGPIFNVEIKTKFFDFNEQDHVYICKLPECTGRLKDVMSSLKRHIAQQHPQIAEKIGLKGYKRKSAQQPISLPSPAKRLKTITIQVDPVDFHCGLVEMPAVNSISFNYFNSHACHATIGPIAKALSIPIYSEAIASNIPAIANIIRGMISDELKNFFCLEFDGASRHYRKIFGINARILQDGKIHTRTLSMMEISEKQTAQNLKKTVEGVLMSYSTDVTHVYSCTSDNGRNVQKCGDELRIAQEKALTSIIVKQEANIEEYVCNTDDIKTDDRDADDQDENDHDEDDHDEDENASHGEIDELLDAVEAIVLTGNESCITTLKCSAHTANLVANDSVDKECDVLKKIRKIVKACRKGVYKSFFDLHKVPLPKIDVETRWGSLYDMLYSLHIRKPVFMDIGRHFNELNLTEDDWNYIAEYVTAFEPLYVLTKALQKNDLILGDVFKLLKICQIKINKLPADNRFVENLKNALEERSKHMLNNNAFRAALLFDQRWCFVDSPYITMEEKLAAIEHMLKVSNILKMFKAMSSGEQQADLPENSVTNNTCDDEIETILEEECQRASTSKRSPSETDLKLRLLDLANSKSRLNSSTDILKHWESRRYEDEELYELAMIALSPSSSQVTVERCFSGIKLLLEQHRLRMSPEMLNDLMVIRFNKDLLERAMEKFRPADTV